MRDRKARVPRTRSSISRLYSRTFITAFDAGIRARSRLHSVEPAFAINGTPCGAGCAASRGIREQRANLLRTQPSDYTGTSLKPTVNPSLRIPNGWEIVS
ncbi:hypothetical protein [Burkholderia pseudomultivorans]|uniref:hypothetical protein n=1 Tax=Burkholderia pseudomultivorans TaxID=1207504 RepID=UPI000AD63104|nr:hypothetical protein [Burkholderia pseudomultivorans]